jgi:two-component system chemotaxis sensor kinase CheA
LEEFKQGFIEEALQLTENIEELLLRIEETASSDEDVQEIFRIMHTIKGSAAMFACL